MRLEHLEGQGGGTIINDTWNHDLDGLSTALDALERLPDGRKRAVILSDLVPFNAQDRTQLERLRRAIGQRRVDRWISVGPGLTTGIPGVSSLCSAVCIGPGMCFRTIERRKTGRVNGTVPANWRNHERASCA